MKSIFTILFLFIYCIEALSQTPTQRAEIIKSYDIKKLNSLAKASSERYQQNKKQAIEIARSRGLKTSFITSDSSFVELQGVTSDGQLLYYKTDNEDAAVSTRTNFLNTGGGSGLNLDGQNMTAYVWDGGHARTTHQEYDGPGGNNRVSLSDVASEGGVYLRNHATHVTGTISAAGVNPPAKGMASHSKVNSYIWNNDIAEAISAALDGMLVSNHSYSLDPTFLDDYFFGGYTYGAYEWDNVLYNAPFYLMVVSAGNLGNNSTYNQTPLDPNNPQFDKLTGQGLAKNNMVVANALDANIDANGNLLSVSINSGSSQGPTDDLRIKPDITGNGSQLLSSIASSDNSYGISSGTSMSAPNVTGSLLLLQQHHNDLFNTFMRASTLKGLAMHTADDAGVNGPDANFGWGLLNAKRAAETLTNNGTTSIVKEIILSQGETYSINVDSDGVNDLLASISWTDPAGAPIDLFLPVLTNDPTPVLINDLDITVTQNSNTYYPWRLTGVNTNANDTDNTVDNFERVDVINPSGTYNISITHKGTLTHESQQVSLIVTGITNVSSFCSSPQNTIVSDISVNSAELTWNPSVSQPGSGYDIYYSSSSNAPNSSTIPSASVLAGVTNYSITGLSADTEYFVYIRSKCGMTDSEWSEVKSFFTLCHSTTFPYLQDFESTSDLPDCWRRSMISQADVFSNCGINNTNYLRLNGGFHHVDSPPVDVSLETVVEVNFDIRNGCFEPSDPSEILNVLYWDGSVWILIDTYDPSDLSAFWVHKSYVISTGLNDSFRIRFQRDGGWIDFDHMSIDNFEVKSPTPAPVNDDACSAIPLSLNPLVSSGSNYSIKAATAQSNEPDNNLDNGIDGSVWFTFVAPASGEVRITADLIGAKSDDLELAVYSASDCSDFTTFAQIDFDQDDGRYVNVGRMPVLDLQGLNSGQTYYIQVDRRPDSSSSTFGLEVLDLYYTYDDSNGYLPIDPSGKELSASEGDLIGGTLEIFDGTATISNPTSFKDIIIHAEAVLDLDADLTSDLVFKSNTNGSGQLAQANGITIYGTTTVERYIPASNKAFRFLSTPVTTTGSIRENWQQNGLNPSDQDYEANVGTHITGDSNGNNGFDATPSGNPSMFTFDNTTTGNQSNAWIQVPNTNTDVLNSRTPYLLFIRGDRSVDLTSGSSLPTPTTLKSSGNLFIGADQSQTLSQENDYFSLVANPYQAIIDFDQVTTNNLRSDIIVYDPSYGTFGQYVTLTNDRFIKPGQSFFVQNDSDVSNPVGGATIEFDESDKNPLGISAVSVFNDENILSLDLHLFNDDNMILDMLKFRFQSGGNNEYGDDDTGKLFGSAENLSSVNSNTYLSVERRDIPQQDEVIPLGIFQYSGTAYNFKTGLQNWDDNIEVVLVDHYLNIETLLTDNQEYNFQVDSSIPESMANDRFSLKLNNSTLGTDELFMSDAISIYPNPNLTGQFNIHFEKLINEKFDVSIYDLTGQEVFLNKSIEKTDDSIQVVLPHHSAGIYVVKLRTEGKMYVNKLILK
jgi:hypothetical protein